MSVLVVGLSHRSAPVSVLERAAVSGDALVKLLHDVFDAPPVAGTFVVSTCNRVEVYADVEKFHGGVSAICDLLAQYSGIALTELTQYLYVHYEDRAVQHLLSMACGLESMIVGEGQILGQVRRSLALAREQRTLGRDLDELGTLALRAAKRAHAETGIDRAGANLVSVGVGLAAARLRPASRGPAGAAGPPGVAGLEGVAGPPGVAGLEGVAGPPGVAGLEGVAGPPGVAGLDGAAEPAGVSGVAAPLTGLQVLVVGAGSISSLAVVTVARLGADHIVVANRTPERAKQLADAVSGTTAELEHLPAALAAADLVISCTGASGLVISAEAVAEALRQRPPDGDRPMVLLDLALPRDVDPAVASLPGVTIFGLDSLQDAGSAVAASHVEDVVAVRAIVADELAARVAARHAARVAPTVVALRAKAAEVVDSELARLAGRLASLDDRAHAEITRAMNRVVDKLLHAPTVRVKELAGSPGGDSYEAALRVLFDLDPGTVEAVTRADPHIVPDASEASGPAAAGEGQW